MNLIGKQKNKSGVICHHKTTRTLDETPDLHFVVKERAWKNGQLMINLGGLEKYTKKHHTPSDSKEDRNHEIMNHQQ